jgi:hypothetical protein
MISTLVEAAPMTDDNCNPDNDPFGPPLISTLVQCIHCGEEYDSFRIEWRVEADADGKPHGFWCCPMPGCDGMGFGFDIFPVDPEYRDENGELMWCDDEDDYEEDDSTLDPADLFDELDEFDELNELELENTNGHHYDEEAPFGKRRTDGEDEIPY